MAPGQGSICAVKAMHARISFIADVAKLDEHGLVWPLLKGPVFDGSVADRRTTLGPRRECAHGFTAFSLAAGSLDARASTSIIPGTANAGTHGWTVA